ncbi:MAG: hypothetical protein BWY82_01073 [Verrucomicrobia bacterium ADurb.Bin474]|nr:MAG: hypothetical protein BWY82_01073 [Verrucomicrobia bacterium ADurb.Bin474]
MTRHYKRPNWIILNFRRHIQRSRNLLNNRGNRVVMLVRDQINPARTNAGCHACHESIHQIVNVERMVEGLAIAKHRKCSFCHPPEYHLKALRIAGAVNRSRTQNDSLKTLGLILRNDWFRLVFRALIVVRRLNRSIFPSRRMINVSVDSAGAAVHKLANLMPQCGINYVTGATHIYLIVK